MKVRSAEEIERAFREIGLTEATWGRAQKPAGEAVADIAHDEQIFIRIECTTTPLETRIHANLA